MRRVVRLRVSPFDWSIGIFVAAAVFLLWYQWQGTCPWWLLIGCLVLSFLVDIAVHGKHSQEEISIE